MEYDENNTKLREELEKYKANLVELVDEVIYTENQVCKQIFSDIERSYSN